VSEHTSEPFLPEPPPRGPGFEEREVPICPTCLGLVRRDILAMTAEGQQFGPWRCDRHGEVTPLFEQFQVPTGYEDISDEDAYPLSDPKHPRFHSTHADIWDAREGK
jgi:hypothetical protein